MQIGKLGIFNQIRIGTTTISIGNAYPISAIGGDIFINSTTTAIYNYSGTGWVIYGYMASGTTAQRPTVTIIGYAYFDTTLGHTIYWNGTTWVDAEPAATISAKGIVNKSAALTSAIPANAAGANPTQAEFNAVVSYLNELVSKLQTAGIQS